MNFFLLHEQSNQPHTFVVVTLDPPIRKGQTLYPHIVLQVFSFPFAMVFIFFFPRLKCINYVVFLFLQFETDYVVQSELSISDDLLNTKYKDKLEPSYKVISLLF